MFRPPVIFLAFANDYVNDGKHLASLKVELKQIRDALQSAAAKGLCEVVERNGAAADDVFQVFLDPRYQDRIAIFHFAGHAGATQLLLESVGGDAEIAGAEGMASFLGLQQSLQLAFLNGCSTAQQTQALLDAGMPCVISTRQPINDQVATDFSTCFYRALANHCDLQTAFETATAAARTKMTGRTRALGLVSNDPTDADSNVDVFPWTMTIAEKHPHVARWNLPAASKNPLLALPPLPRMELPAKPYRYLNWYRKRDAAVFFGRGKEIRDLYKKITTPTSAPVILFYGRSGVGKSSLLDAGLIPRLESKHEVTYLRRDRDRGLLGTVIDAFPDIVEDRSPKETWLEHEAKTGRPLTIILDQLEEIETRPNASLSDEMKRFMDAVQEVFENPQQRPQGRLILGFRKEWLADVKKQLEQREVLFNEVFLEHLDREGVIDAILGPIVDPDLATHYQLSIDDGLADQICDDLLEDSQGNIAPTLQILLSRMWDSAKAANSASPRFTRELYASRRKGMLMTDFLKEQLGLLEQECGEYAPPDLLIDALAMHTTPLGTANQIAMSQLRETYQHHEGNLSKLLTAFQDAYLLTMPDAQVVNEIVSTRLAHDTLAPLVRERFEASPYPGQHARKILENRVGQWENGQIGTPLDDEDLSIVEAGHNGMRDWTPDERRMIEASRIARDRRMRDRRRWKVIGVIAVNLIVAVGIIATIFGIKATKQERLAENALAQAQLATQEANAAFADAQASALAATTAQENANRQRERAEIESQRAQSITYGSQVKLALLNWQRGRPGSAFQNLESTQDDQRDWEFFYLKQLFANGFSELQLPYNSIKSIALSPPTRSLHSVRTGSSESFTYSLVAGGGENEQYGVYTVDAYHGGIQGARAGKYSEIKCVAYSPDGQKICVGHIDGKLELQHTSDYRQQVLAPGVSLGIYPRSLPIGVYPNAINSAEFSADSKRLVSGNASGVIQMWKFDGVDVEVEPQSLQSSGAAVQDIQFSADGESVVWVSDDGRLSRIDLSNPTEPTILADDIEDVRSLAVSPRGSLIATGGSHLIIWDTSKPDTPGVAMRSVSGLHKDTITCLAFTSDGSRLVSGSVDQTVKVWDVTTRDLVQTFTGHHCVVTDLCVTPDGMKIFSSGTDGRIKTWPVDPEPPTMLTTGALRFIKPIDNGFVAIGGYPQTAFTYKNQRQLFPQAIPEFVVDIDIQNDSSRWFFSTNTGSLTRLNQSWRREGEMHDGKSIASTPAGPLVAMTLSSGEIEILQSDDGKSIRRLSGHKDFTGDIEFSDDGRQLVSVGGDGIKVWNVSTGELRQTIDLTSLVADSPRQSLPTSSSEYFPCQVAFTRDSKQIIAALGYGLGMSLWDIDQASLKFRFDGADNIDFFAMNPDGTRVASKESPEGNGVDVWETRFGTKVLTLEGHTDYVYSVAFVDDGKTLVSGDAKGNLIQWKAGETP
ncbi:nSTAND1 domain-containing NTPase [Stieleria varia]|uniref:WD domain, G-beta repeat n=1 Tax=Stieleria varia TaxID=2528005 RepID=A0A5C6A1K0_9BACT|nr:CHAT domain-containing protein [Stieleria varia]TWT93296.1 WD domain, G-beta repeat [Stieleria varia]